MKKIVLFGPSGSGKTTLAKYVSKNYGLKHIPSKDTRIVPESVQQRWFDHYKYHVFGNIGHRALINLQSKYPEFGTEWQLEMLKARNKVFNENPNFVADRSQVDSVTYMLSQVGHNITKRYFDDFMKRALEGYQNLDGAIFIKTIPTIEIEDNKSRITLLEFQLMMSSTFEFIWKTYFEKITSVKSLVIDVWDLDKRKELIDLFME